MRSGPVSHLSSPLVSTYASTLGVLAISLAIAAALSSCQTPTSPAARMASDDAALRRGRSLFVGTCGAYCHGLQPGHRDAPYLFDCEWKHGSSDQAIFDTISRGVPNTRMQAFGGRLPEGDEDIWRIVAFLRSKATCD